MPEALTAKIRLVTGLILTQAALVAHALAAAALSTRATALAGTLVLLLGVVVAPAAATYGGEAAALRAAAVLAAGLLTAVTGLTAWGVLLLGVAATGTGVLSRVPLEIAARWRR